MGEFDDLIEELKQKLASCEQCVTKLSEEKASIESSLGEEKTGREDAENLLHVSNATLREKQKELTELTDEMAKLKARIGSLQGSLEEEKNG